MALESAEHCRVPAFAKGISDGRWWTWKKLVLLDEGLLRQTCQFQLDECKGLLCLVKCSRTAGFLSIFALLTEFSMAAWDAQVDSALSFSPLWPACWLQCPDHSRHSSSEAVRRGGGPSSILHSEMNISRKFVCPTFTERAILSSPSSLFFFYMFVVTTFFRLFFQAYLSSRVRNKMMQL